MTTPDLREAFAAEHPDFPLLSLEAPDLVARVLAEVGWLERGEELERVEKPGEGNMNLTLRVITDRRSLIVKQSRPWVEKYDVIAAPFDRALREAAFYRRIADLPEVASCMPRLLAADRERRLLCLEDLGAGADLSTLYGGEGHLSPSEARALGGFLRALHEGTRGTTSAELENLEMRKLNAEHIFDVPLRAANGVDVEAFEPGLSAVATELREDSELRARLAELRQRYLAPRGDVLLHGDFFPGSWLRLDGGELAVIDPEFAFYGDPEFDLGVAMAHLCLAGVEDEVRHALISARGSGAEREKVAAYAGAEVIRRLLGVAQLPLPPTQGRRARLLAGARRAVLERDLQPLEEASA